MAALNRKFQDLDLVIIESGVATTSPRPSVQSCRT